MPHQGGRAPDRWESSGSGSCSWPRPQDRLCRRRRVHAATADPAEPEISDLELARRIAFIFHNGARRRPSALGKCCRSQASDVSGEEVDDEPAAEAVDPRRLAFARAGYVQSAQRRFHPQPRQGAIQAGGSVDQGIGTACRNPWRLRRPGVSLAKSPCLSDRKAPARHRRRARSTRCAGGDRRRASRGDGDISPRAPEAPASSAQPPLGHQPPYSTLLTIAASSAPRSTPVCPPDRIFLIGHKPDLRRVARILPIPTRLAARLGRRSGCRCLPGRTWALRGLRADSECTGKL
jgi:hypothetical protein